MTEVTSDCNLMIMICEKGTPERNATILCVQVDYAFLYGVMPYPYELFKYLVDTHNASIIRK